MLEDVEENKKYYLATGRHAAIIRKSKNNKNNSFYEYLELQAPSNRKDVWNGYHDLTDKELKDRFKCQKTHTMRYWRIKASSILINIETLGEDQEFLKILGYINTNEDKQRKSWRC